MKKLMFRLLCTYYHWKVLRAQDYGVKSCWDYAESFLDNIDEVEWRTIVADAEWMVDEDFSYWTE